jgi:hypothetical protein
VCRADDDGAGRRTREVVDAQAVVVHGHRVHAQAGARCGVPQPSPTRVFHGQIGDALGVQRPAHTYQTVGDSRAHGYGHGVRVRAARAPQVLRDGGAQHRVPGGVGQAEVIVDGRAGDRSDGVRPAAARKRPQVGQAGREVVPDRWPRRCAPRARPQRRGVR